MAMDEINTRNFLENAQFSRYYQHQEYIANTENDSSSVNINIMGVPIGASKPFMKERDIKVSAMDVAVYILEKIGTCSTMKLHKLLYYSQAWSTVWDGAPLFDDRIEAWSNGPVVRSLFAYHRGLFSVSSKDFLPGNSNRLSIIQRETVDEVIKFYGDKTAQWLINLTHSEQPWLDARKGLDNTERGQVEITPSAMAEYYSSLE